MTWSGSNFYPGCPWSYWKAHLPSPQHLFLFFTFYKILIPCGTLWQADSNFQLPASHSWFTDWHSGFNHGQPWRAQSIIPCSTKSWGILWHWALWGLSDWLSLFLLKVFNHMSVYSLKSSWVVDVPEAHLRKLRHLVLNLHEQVFLAMLVCWVSWGILLRWSSSFFSTKQPAFPPNMLSDGWKLDLRLPWFIVAFYSVGGRHLGGYLAALLDGLIFVSNCTISLGTQQRTETQDQETNRIHVWREGMFQLSHHFFLNSK